MTPTEFKGLGPDHAKAKMRLAGVCHRCEIESLPSRYGLTRPRFSPNSSPVASRAGPRAQQQRTERSSTLEPC